MEDNTERDAHVSNGRPRYDRRYLTLILASFLTSCGIFPPVTIPDVGIYLAQSRCPDGGPAVAACADSRRQRAADPMFWRRRDWPLPGYQVEDSVVSNDGSYFITTWSYPPFGPFRAENGDGGEVYVVRDGVVWICCTQDGGTGGIHRFADWWVFDNKTPAGSWRQGHPKTRARRETVTFPASGYGLTSITADTIISEHYDWLNLRGKMERFYLGAGWGRLLWQAWVPPEMIAILPPATDLAVRCPPVSWDGPPPERPDWVLYDCRLVTNLVEDNGSMSVETFGWPPNGFVP